MADVQQIETVDPEFILLDGGGDGLLPVAQAIHRGFVGLDATTGTDTANLRLTLTLPGSLAWQMRTWNFTIDGGSGEWVQGRLEYFYAPSTTEFGASTQINFPLFHAASITVPEGGVTNQNWGLGYADTTNAVQGSWVIPMSGEQSPMDLVTFVDESTGPVIAISSGSTADVAAATARFAFTWLGYTFEQMRSAFLHTGFNSRV